MNPKRAAWEERYKASKLSDKEGQQCRLCMQWSRKSDMVPHHPRGRHGENILHYI
jgi:hypothetical protein